ncbi:MAG: flippase [Bacilli bacterium]|nr:flippase [Bacilli bacterium]
MEKQSVRKNYFYNTALQFALLAIPILLIPYVSRVLGVEKVGDYSFYLAMVTYFSMFAVLGTGAYGQREIAYCRNDVEELRISFFNTFFFRVITSALSIGVYFLYLFLANSINAVCTIFALNILNVVFDVTWFFQGVEDFKQIVFKNLFFKLLNLVLVFLFVKKPSDLWVYVLIMCGTTLMGNVSTWTRLKKYIKFDVSGVNPFNNIKEIVLVFLPTIAIQVYTVLDKSMIGWITNSSYANGCYDRAEQISRVALTLVTSVAAVILPRVSNSFKNGDIETAKEYIYKAFAFVWMLSVPITFGLLACSDSFIPLFLGDGYDDAALLLKIFSPLVIFVSLSYVIGLSYLISTKQQNVYTIAVVISAIVNLIMNLLLIPKLSAVGAAIASVTAEFVGCSFQIVYCILKKQLSFKKLFKNAWKYCLFGIAMFFSIFKLPILFENPIIGLIVTIFVGFFIYVFLLLITRDKMVFGEISVIINKIKKRREHGQND